MHPILLPRFQFNYDRLPPRTKACFTLYVRDRMSIEDIAHTLEITPRVAYEHIFRAGFLIKGRKVPPIQPRWQFQVMVCAVRTFEYIEARWRRGQLKKDDITNSARDSELQSRGSLDEERHYLRGDRHANYRVRRREKY